MDHAFPFLLSKYLELVLLIHIVDCRGPALVDPGNLKQGWSQRLGKDYLNRNIKRD